MRVAGRSESRRLTIEEGATFIGKSEVTQRTVPAKTRRVLKLCAQRAHQSSVGRGIKKDLGLGSSGPIRCLQNSVRNARTVLQSRWNMRRPKSSICRQCGPLFFSVRSKPGLKLRTKKELPRQELFHFLAGSRICRKRQRSSIIDALNVNGNSRSVAGDLEQSARSRRILSA